MDAGRRAELLNELMTSYKELDLRTMTSAEDILFDLKRLIQDFYIATFTLEADALKILFDNGQSFLIKVEEIKE